MTRKKNKYIVLKQNCQICDVCPRCSKLHGESIPKKPRSQTVGYKFTWEKRLQKGEKRYVFVGDILIDEDSVDHKVVRSHVFDPSKSYYDRYTDPPYVANTIVQIETKSVTEVNSTTILPVGERLIQGDIVVYQDDANGPERYFVVKEPYELMVSDSKEYDKSRIVKLILQTHYVTIRTDRYSKRYLFVGDTLIDDVGRKHVVQKNHIFDPENSHFNPSTDIAYKAHEIKSIVKRSSEKLTYGEKLLPGDVVIYRNKSGNTQSVTVKEPHELMTRDGDYNGMVLEVVLKHPWHNPDYISSRATQDEIHEYREFHRELQEWRENERKRERLSTNQTW